MNIDRYNASGEKPGGLQGRQQILIFWFPHKAIVSCILVSHPPPACFSRAVIVYLSISRSVRINDADLHVDLLLTEPQNNS